MEKMKEKLLSCMARKTTTRLQDDALWKSWNMFCIIRKEKQSAFKSIY